MFIIGSWELCKIRNDPTCVINALYGRKTWLVGSLLPVGVLSIRVIRDKKRISRK